MSTVQAIRITNPAAVAAVERLRARLGVKTATRVAEQLIFERLAQMEQSEQGNSTTKTEGGSR